MNNNITSKQFIKEAHLYSKGKVCSICNNHKLLNDFSKDKTAKDGLQYRCKSCAIEYKNNMCRFKRWFQNKKKDAKFKGIEFSIEPTDIPGVIIREKITIGKCSNGQTSYTRKYVSWEGVQYPQVCSKWDVKLDWGMNGIQYNSPSMDRIDPRFGYIPGNVRLVCQSYNMAKGNCPPDVWDVLEKQIARSILGMIKPY